MDKPVRGSSKGYRDVHAAIKKGWRSSMMRQTFPDVRTKWRRRTRR